MDGVQDLHEIDADHYTAVLETRVAYLKFRFNVAVQVVRAEPPLRIEAKIEGKTIEVPVTTEAPTTQDLMAALRASVAAAKK